jgi:sugar phosphate isomerase/epimerase
MVEALKDAKTTAFHYVDMELAALDAPGVSEALRELGLKVSCVALDHGLPRDCSLEGDDPAALRRAIEHIKRGLDKCVSAGARTAYVTSCRHRKNLKTFAPALKELAEAAGHRGIRLCVEHAPGRALSTAREALTFVDGGQPSNLHLLLDTGHALISKEKSHEIVAAAGKRLGYVQMNDNDGRSDKHWALLDGRMKQEDLALTLEALRQIGYEGTLGLEIRYDRASVTGGLAKNRNLLLRMQLDEEAKSLKEPETRRKK